MEKKKKSEKKSEKKKRDQNKVGQGGEGISIERKRKIKNKTVIK